MESDTKTCVLFPNMKPTWPVVVSLLEDLKTQSQEPYCDLRELAKSHQQVLNVNRGGLDSDPVEYGNSAMYGLVKYLKKYASDGEKRRFLQSTFPAIINLAIQLPQRLPVGNISCSKQQEANTTTLSRQCIASIMACSFLCLLEEIQRPWMTGSKMNVANFTSFFKNLPMPSQNAKIKCILEYFEQVSERWDHLQGNLTFVRQVIPREEIPTLDTWLNCDSELCPLVVHEEGLIEDAGCDAVEVDFANRYIGGGVLGKGRVQEEIRFTVCPELLASLIFMECMEENEAIIIKGYKQFTYTVGYAASLQYGGRWNGSTKSDDNGDLMTTMCAIDAVSYRSRPERQYTDQMCVRDLNKAYVGFSARCLRGTSPPRNDYLTVDLDTSTGDNFSSLTDEEYLTASDEEGEIVNPALKLIRNLAEGLVVDMMSSALLEASSVLLKSDLDSSSNKIQVEPCDTQVAGQNESQVQEDDGMDHLDVANWVMQNHRRSSNLSDMGSRRSSTSTKHSSEFSSEFEEYFENFQKRDQPVIHKTIKEEIFPEISEFASNLAAKLLQEGAFSAVHVKPEIQNFHSEAPDEVMVRPKARKSSEEASEEQSVSELYIESGHSSSDSETPNDSVVDKDDICRAQPSDISEEIARKFADNFIRNLMPFPKTITFSNSSKQSCDECDNAHDFLSGNPQREIFSDVLEEGIVASNFGLGESESTCSDSMPGYWFLRKNSASSVDADLNRNNAISRSSSQASQDSCKQKLPVTRKMKQLATDFVAEVVIGAIQKYSQEMEQENYLPENVLHLQNHDNYDDDEEEDENEKFDIEQDKWRKADADIYVNKVSSDGFPDINKYTSFIGNPSQHLSSNYTSEVAGTASLQTLHSYTDLDDIDREEYLHGRINDDQANKTSRNFPSINEESCDNYKDLSGSYPFSEEQKAIPKVFITDSETKDLLFVSVSEKKVKEEFSNALKGLERSKSTVNHAEKALKTKPDVILKKTRSHTKVKNQSDYDSSHSKYNLQNLPLGTSASKFSGTDSHHRDHSFEEKEPRKVTFFASSLSRDLLTNAFVEVQRNMNGGNVYRRSSEPLKISNHESQNLHERSINGTNRRHDRTRYQSLTDEDVGRFAQELTRWGSLEDFRNRLRRGSCGFRDPTLSRFAEQLMKSNCSVPDLYLLGSTNMSTSGDSSASRRSSMSGFKDSTLASFEEELLFSSHGRNSLRGAKLKSAKKSAKLVRQKCLVKDNILDVRESTSTKSLHGKSFDSETSGLSWGSFQSSSCSQSFDEMSTFADRLAQSVVQESFETLVRGAMQEAVIPGTTCPTIQKPEQHVSQQVGDFANNMANDVVIQAFMSLASCYLPSAKQKKRSSDAASSLHSDTNKTRSVSETESMEMCTSSSDEFTDALDIPFIRLESYAEQVAARVLQHSVNIFQREMDSEHKRRLGRPIATGNWGCGAFRGDPTLKAMLQWMAASYAGTPFVMYYTFQNPELEQLQNVVDAITSKGWKVGHLMQAVRRYCTTLCEMEDPSQSPNLFHLLLSEDTFADIE